MKRLEVSTPPGWDASYTPALYLPVLIYIPGRGTVKVQRLQSSALARLKPGSVDPKSGMQTITEATVPPTAKILELPKYLYQPRERQ